MNHSLLVMAAAKIQSLEFLTPESGLASEAGSADLRVALEDGGHSSFVVATPDQPSRWMADDRADFSFGTPIVFVRALDHRTVTEAAQAMAAEMSGYWLRYYNSESDRSKVARTLGGKRASKPRAGGALKIVSTAITEAYPPRSPDHGCAVVQVAISDGREFSLLTATPPWFEKAFAELGLPFYFGPSILFVRRLDSRLAREAVKAMAADGDRWLCRYDTPRRRLPEVLARFKS